MTTHGSAALAAPLLETLQHEAAALTQLRTALLAQIEALSHSDRAALEAATETAGTAAGALARLRGARERQLRLLGRHLGLAPDEITVARVAEALQAHEAAHAPGTDGVGGALMTLRADVHAAADAAQRLVGQVEFTLRYAAALGREMLTTLQAFDAPATGRLYTAGGARTALTPRPLVNTLG